MTIKNKTADPWNDPRFWIISDWAFAWGDENDFLAIQNALHSGAQRNNFERLFKMAKEIPGFFSQKPQPFTSERKRLLEQAQQKVIESAAPNKHIDIDFSQIKVVLQPGAPAYPTEAKSRRMMTNLVVNIIVNEQGKPTFCRPIPGPWLAFFAPTGVEYAMRWRFMPATLNGQPQQARFRLTMPFRLKK